MHLSGLKMVARIVGAIFLALISTDVSNVSFFNSFYSESASLVFFTLLVGLFLTFNRRERIRAWQILLFLAAGGAFVAAKPQNHPLVVPLVLIVAVWLWRRPRWVNAVAFVGGGFALVLLTADLYGSVSPVIKRYNCWNVLFYSVLADSYYVWVGTEAGVYTLDREKSTWYRFATPDGLLMGEVRSIARCSHLKPSSGKEEIWFGTDLGILGYSPVSDETEVYDNRMNFPEVDVVKITCDSKTVWVATRDGVWKLNRATDI